MRKVISFVMVGMGYRVYMSSALVGATVRHPSKMYIIELFNKNREKLEVLRRMKINSTVLTKLYTNALFKIIC